MLHIRMSWIAVVVVIAGCGDQDPGNGLLSASRLSLAERETARVHVSVENVEDFEYTAPDGITITPLTDAFGPGFDVTATCAAAQGVDATVTVEVRDRTSARTAALVVAVTDDSTEACAAAISMWLEPCGGDACSDPCGPVQPATALLALPRDTDARLCARAEELDPARPLSKGAFSIAPGTSAFDQGTPANGTQAIVVRGSRAHWLVGPYQAMYAVRAGSIQLVRSVPLDIGAPGDVGIEVPKEDVAVAEFARGVAPITVHRFPNLMTDDCAIEIRGVCRTLGNVALYAASNGFPACTPVDCRGSPHSSFTLAYVPEIDAAERTMISIAVTSAMETLADVGFAVTSRAENLTGCGGNSTRLACADVNGDGALEVVTNGTNGTCVFSVTDWRMSSSSDGSGVAVPGRIVTEAGRTVLAIAASPAALWKLDAPQPNTWAWTRVWASRTGEEVPADAVLIRSTPSGATDYLVGTVGGVLRFVSRADGSLLGEVNTGLLGNFAIGVVDVGGGGQDVALVATSSLSPGTGQRIYIFKLDWPQPVTGPPSVNVTPYYAFGTVQQMPDAISADRVTIAARPRPGLDDDIVVSFYDGPFASGVAELRIAQGAMTQVLLAGAVRSIAAAPDGAVLYGHEGGARRSWVDAMNNNAIVRETIDPVVDLAPDPAYGTKITPCFDKASMITGFVVQTEPDAFRIAQLGIVPQTP